MRFKIVPLEERIVLDAAGISDLLDIDSYDLDDSLDTASALSFEESYDSLNDQATTVIAPFESDKTRVLVVSSAIEDGDILIDAAKEGVLIVYYDSRSSLDSLADQISSFLGNQSADSIAFAQHGQNGEIILTDTIYTNLDTINDAEQQNFWNDIGHLLSPNGRIDFLACNLAGSAEGLELIDFLENLTDADIAASTNLTGNPLIESPNNFSDNAINADDMHLLFDFLLHEESDFNDALDAEAAAEIEATLSEPSISNSLDSDLNDQSAQLTDEAYTQLSRDWFLELGSIDAAETYFETALLNDWDHTLANIISTTSGNSHFAEGQYISIGVSGNGSLGSSVAAPAGINDTGTNPLHGLSFDYDGFATSNEAASSYFLPGAPEVEFGIGYNGTFANNVQTQDTGGIAGVTTNESTASLADIQFIGDYGDLNIERHFTFSEYDKAITVTFTLTNTSGSTINNVRYMHSLDLDIDQEQHGDFKTNQQILNTFADGDKRATVSAVGPVSGYPLIFDSFQEEAVAYYGGFSNRDPDPNIATYIKTKSSAIYDDAAIGMIYDIGSLAAGETYEGTYQMIMDPTDPVLDSPLALPSADDQTTHIQSGESLNDTLKTRNTGGSSIIALVGGSTTSAGGTVTLTNASKGEFTYTPINASYTGEDTFNWSLDGLYIGEYTIKVGINEAPIVSVPTAVTTNEDAAVNIPAIIVDEPNRMHAGDHDVKLTLDVMNGTLNITEEDLLDFDGVDDYISFSSNAIVSPPGTYTPDLSKTAWFKTNTTSGRQVIWAQGESTNGLLIYIDSGKLYSRIWSVSNGFVGNHVSTPIDAGTWHHVAITLDADNSSDVVGTDNYRLYLDGQLMASTNSARLHSHNPIHIGSGVGNTFNYHTGQENTGNYFDGQLRNISSWDKTLSQDEIQQYMTEDPPSGATGLQGYWKLDEATGAPTAIDSSGSGLSGTNGTYHGSLTASSRISFIDSTNNGSSKIVLQGSILEMNRILDSLVYTPDENFNTANIDEVISVTVNDLGNTGSGGALSESQNITINVNAVNDAPSIKDPSSAGFDANKSLSLDGVNDYVDLEDFTFGGGDFAAEAWIKYDGEPINFSRIFDFGNGSASNNIILSAFGTTRKISLFTYNDNVQTYIVSSALIPTDEWLHVAASFVDNDGNTGTATLYFNGELVGSGTIMTPKEIIRRNNYLGKSNWNDPGGFNGKIDQVRLWDKSLSQADIQQNMHQYLTGDESDLFALWNFDDPAGNIQNEVSSGTQINGTLINGATINIETSIPSITIDEDSTFAFNEAATVTLSDVDSGSNDIQVTLSANNGTINFGTTTGLNFSSGSNNSGNFTVLGTLSEINAALASMSYTGDLNYYGNDQITISVNDLGNSGSGGALTDTQVIDITINSINDAPVIHHNFSDDKVLSLDGVNDYVGLESFTFGGGDFTAESWIKYDHLPDIATIFALGNGPVTNVIELHKKYNDDSFYSNIQSKTINSSASIPINEWNHVAISFDQSTSTVNFYANGEFTGSNTVSTPPDVLRTINTIGGVTWTDTRFFDGQIDEMRLWSKKLSQSEIQTNMNSRLTGNETDLFALWNFDNETGGIIGNEASTQINGTLYNGAKLIPITHIINEDETLTFTGSETISISDVDSGSNDIELTLSASQGNLELTTITGLTITSGANNSSNLTVLGTLNEINAALATLAYTGDLNYYGDDQISLTIDDLGHSGSGGSLTTNHLIDIIVSPFNDAPTVTSIPSITVDEDAPNQTVNLEDYFQDLEDLDNFNYTLSNSNASIVAASVNNILTLDFLENQHGSATITITGTDTDGLQVDTTLLVNINPINDSPIIAHSTIETIDLDNRLTLDGLDDYVDLDDFTFGGGDFAFETWLKYDNTISGRTSIFDFGKGANDHNILLFFDSAKKLDFFIMQNGITRITSTIALPEDEWAHIAFSFVDNDGSTGTGTFYINGELAGSGTIETPKNVLRSSNFLGQSNFNVPNFSGSLGEFRLWDKSLSQSEIEDKMLQKLTGNETDLFALWNFDDTGGSISNKVSSGSTIDGILEQGAAIASGSNIIEVSSLENPSHISINEDESFNFTGLSNIIISDDAGLNDIQLTLSASHGAINLGTTTGLNFSSGSNNSNSFTALGTLDEINTALATLSYTGDLKYHGDDQISITVDDLGNSGSGGPLTGSQVINITINPVNDTPTATTLPTINVDEDAANQTVNLATYFEDVEDLDDLTYTIGNNNTSIVAASVNNTTNVLTLDPVLNQFGTANITVTATDSGGLQVSKVFAINIASVNDTPTATTLPTINVNEDAANQTVNLATYFEDIEDLDDLTYTIGNNNTSIVAASVNNTTNILTLDPVLNQFGTANITVTATDSGGLQVSKVFAINIASVNDTPTATTLPTINVNEDASSQTVSLATYFEDVEDLDDLTYTIGNNNTSIVAASVNNTTNILTLDPVLNQFGTANITVTGIDSGGLQVSKVFAINIASVNDTPTATTLPTINVNEDAANQTVNLATYFEDIEDLDDLTYTIGNNNTSIVAASVNNTTNILTLDPVLNQFGTANITVTATDSGGLQVSKIFALNIASVNDTPTATNPPIININEDASSQTVSLATYFEDVEDADNLTYTVINSNSSIVAASVNNTTNVLTLDPLLHQFGTANITVTATDSGGLQVSKIFAINIASINDIPTVITIPSINVDEDAPNQTVSLEDYFQDVENFDNLTYSLTNSNSSIMTASVNNTTNTLTVNFLENKHGNGTITVTATDSDGDSIDQDLSVIINPINDTPTITIASPAMQFTDEDTELSITNLSVSDVDLNSGNEAIMLVTITANEGTLHLANSANLDTYSGHTSTSISLSGEQSILNTALASLKYTPGANFHGMETLNVTVNDQGDYGAGGPLSSTENLNIVVITRNDAPILTLPSAPNIAEDTESDLTGISISDVDVALNPDSEFTVTISAANGIFSIKDSFNQDSLTNVSNDESNNLTMTGTVSTVNAALNNLRYQADAHFYGTDTITATVSDLGSNTQQAAKTDNGIFTINVTSVNDLPIWNNIPSDQTINEDSQLVLTGISASDVDLNPASDTITVTVSAQSGALTLANSDNGSSITLNDTLDNINTALASITYQGDNNFHGSEMLTLSFNDGVTTVNSTIAVSVIPVNDSPTLSVPGTQTVIEDTPKSITGFSLGDVDSTLSPNMEMEITLNADSGQINLDGDVGETVKLQGTIAELTTALGNISYSPATHHHGTSAATISVQLNDLGNTGLGSPNIETANIQVNISSINDAPVFKAPTIASTNEDTNLTLSGVYIDDIDASLNPSNEVSIDLSVDSGLISLSQLSGLNFTTGDGNNDTAMSFTGTVENVNLALTNLVYTPAANHSGTAIIDLDVDDQANGGSGALTDSTSIAITIDAINDAPVITAPSSQNITEDTASIISGLDLNDVDATASNLLLALSAQHGTLTIDTSGLPSINFDPSTNNGEAALIFSGTQTDLKAALATVTYTSELNYQGEDVFTIAVDDRGSSGLGEPLVDVKNINLSIAAVNDAPTISVPGAQSANEDTPLEINGVSLSDIDITNHSNPDNFTLTLSVNDGSINISGAELSFDNGAESGNATVIVNGSLDALNNALENLEYTGDVNFFGTDTLNITLNDNGNFGSGSPLSDHQNIVITVANINDAPLVTTSTSNQSATEDITQAITGVSINDVDHTSSTVTLTVQQGSLDFSENISALSFTTGKEAGNSIVQFSGDTSDINTALAGLTYTNNLNYNQTELLQIQADDGEKTHINTVNITIAAVNDMPEILAPNNTQVALEDVTLAIPGISLNDVDVAETINAEMTLSLVAANGTLELLNTDHITITGNGSNTVNIEGNIVDINNTISSLTYKGNLNFNGADTITINAGDQGNSGSGGALDADTVIVNIDIGARNDAPIITATETQTIQEEASFSFSGDLHLSDVDIASNDMTLIASAVHGTLRFASEAPNKILTFTGNITDVQDKLDDLEFISAPEFNGTDIVNIKVNDLGNTGTGGAKEDQVNIIFTVLATNDAPEITVPGAQTLDEDNSHVITGIHLFDQDINETIDAKMEVTLSVNHGTMKLQQTDGLTFTVGDGVNSDAMTFQGNLANINRALLELTYSPSAHYNGSDTISIDVDDLGNTGIANNLTDSSTIELTINPIDDNPTAFSDEVTHLEDTDVTIVLQGIDIDGDPLTARIIDYPGNGLLYQYDNGNRGDLIDITDPSSYTITDSQLRVIFVADANRNDDNYSSFTYAISDDGIEFTNKEPITINTTAVNDPAEISAPSTAILNEDELLIFGTSHLITFSDVDALETEDTQASVSLSVTNGSLTMDPLTPKEALTINSGNESGNLNLRGSIEAINAAIVNLRYTPDEHFNGSDPLEITIVDEGHTGVNGIQTTQHTIDITVNAVNDSPMIHLSGSQSLDIPEDTALPFNVSNTLISFSDVDAAETNNGELSVTLSSLHGNLWLTDATNLTGSNLTTGTLSSLSFTGTIADINSAIETLHYQGAPNYNGADALTITVNDQGNTGINGILEDVTVIPLNVLAINDPPVISLVGSPTLTLDEDSSIDINNGNTGNTALVSIADIDSAETEGGPLKLTLSVSHGTIRLGSTSGLTPIEGSSSSAEGATLIVEGEALAINAALANLSYASENNYNGGDTLTIRVDDRGATGSGGELFASQELNFVVNAINDAPTNTITGPGSITTDEDHAITIHDTHTITIADVDHEEIGGGDIQVTLNANHGNLNINTTGLSSSSGLNSKSITIQGSAEQINTALLSLTYLNDLNVNGNDELEIVVDDLGNSGAGVTPTAIEKIDLIINPINDAPVINENALNDLTTINEDTLDPAGDLVSTILASAISHVDANPQSGIAITFVDTSHGDWQYHLSGESEWINISNVSESNALLLDTQASIRFVPVEHYNGDSYLKVRAWDQTTGALAALADVSNNGGITAFSADEVNLSITVNPINDAPEIILSNGNNTSVLEDQVLIFDANLTQINISDLDAAESTLEVTLEAQNGTLWLTNETGLTGSGLTTANGSSIITFTGNQEAINSTIATLKYQGNPHFTGNDTLTISVNDQGNHGNGGSLTSTQDIHINVEPINDAPVLSTSPVTLTDIIEDIESSSNNGNLISDMLNGALSDPDAPYSTTSEGLAITATDSSNGHWQYQLDGATDWISIDNVSTSSALLLENTTKVRFEANEYYNGSASITYRAWDQTDGFGEPEEFVDTSVNGDSTAYSVNEAIATISITPVDNPPIIRIDGNQELLVLDEETLFYFENADTDNRSLIYLEEVDSGAHISPEVRMSLTVQNGTLALLDNTGLDVTVSTARNIIFEGSISNINNALSSLSYIGDLDFHENEFLTMSAEEIDAGDPSPLVDHRVLTMNILDDNAPPTDIILSQTAIDEHVNIGTLLGELSTIDPDLQDTSHSYTFVLEDGSLSDTSGSFAIYENTIYTTEEIHFEATETLEFTVRSTDERPIEIDRLHLDKVFTIVVNDRNDSLAPTGILLDIPNPIYENSPGNTLVGTLTTLDPDPDYDEQHVYLLLDDADDRFVIVDDQLFVKEGGILDIESDPSHFITIISLDSTSNLSPAVDMELFLTNVNDFSPYDIRLSSSTIAENSYEDTLVGILEAYDQDFEDTHTFTLNDDADGRFKIVENSTTGKFELRVNADNVLDYEEALSYAINVTVSDAGGIEYTKNLTIDLSNVNDNSPTAIHLSNDQTYENAEFNTLLGVLSTDDADRIDHHTYQFKTSAFTYSSIVNPFALIENDSGQTEIRIVGDIDFEEISSYRLEIESTDSGGSTQPGGPLLITQFLDIDIYNRNEAAQLSILSDHKTAEDTEIKLHLNIFDEDSDSNSLVQLELKSQEGGTFHISTGNDKELQVQKLTGRISDVNAKLENLVYTPSSNFNGIATIEASLKDLGSGDEVSLTTDTTFNIEISAVNDAPDNVLLDNTRVFDDQANGSIIGKLTAEDVDTNDTHTHTHKFILEDGSLSDAYDAFKIVGNELQLSNATLLDPNGKPKVDLNIRTIDQDGAFVERTIILDIINVPKITNPFKDITASLANSSDLTNNLSQIGESTALTTLLAKEKTVNTVQDNSNIIQEEVTMASQLLELSHSLFESITHRQTGVNFDYQTHNVITNNLFDLFSLDSITKAMDKLSSIIKKMSWRS